MSDWTRGSWVMVLGACLCWTSRLTAQLPRPSRGGLLDVRVEELKAAFRKELNRELDVANYQAVTRAMQCWLAHDGRANYAGRWSGEEGGDEADQPVYGLIMVDPDAVLEVKLDELRAVYKKAFQRDLQAGNYRDVQQALNRWLVANRRGAFFGFWNGAESKDRASNAVIEVVLIHPASTVSVKLDDLKATFQKHFNRPLDADNYRAVTLAVNRWLSANKLGNRFGFWNGEATKDSAGNFVCGVALLAPSDGADLDYVPDSSVRVCQLTGDHDRATGRPTLSQTGQRFGVRGTDLGSSFAHKGKLYFLFGDTEDDRDALGWTESKDPYKLLLEFFPGKNGKIYPLTVPGISQGAFEVPSGGTSLRDIIYVVCTTDHTEKRVMGRSVLARSRDDGRTFQKLYDLSRSKFINVSFLQAGDWMYIYGSGTYRKSNVFLARVRPADIENRAKLEYFTGTGEAPRWSPTEAEAVPLFNHPQIGEFSAAYLKPVNRFVLLYGAVKPDGMILRSAETPWGPWSDGTVIFNEWRDHGYGHFIHISSKFKGKQDTVGDPGRAEDWGGAYGPYIMARYTAGEHWACRIFYTMSTWNPYQVVVMQSALRLR